MLVLVYHMVCNIEWHRDDIKYLVIVCKHTYDLKHYIEWFKLIC